jgi:DNA-binding NarL/FixJ family response regulator
MPRVLIVDDQKFVRDTLLSFLSQHEPAWELSAAVNGEQALEISRNAAPDVVVLDIVMEAMNGVVAACEIRQIAPGTKIIFISSHYTTGDASVISRLIGAEAFIQKSETARLLIPTIKRLLDGTSQAA